MDTNTYHRQLLITLFADIKQTAPFDGENFSEQDHAFMFNFNALVDMDNNESFFQLGQQLLCQIVAAYPQLTIKIPRDLLWYFSGDCLHFLSDEEIDMYSVLDEMRYEAESSGEVFNMVDAKAKLKKLH